MKYLRASYFVIIILINLVFSSFTFNVGANDDFQVCDYLSNDFEDLSGLISLLPTGLGVDYDMEVGLFFTVSTSGGSDAFHIQFPLLLRTLKPTGLCILVIVAYSSEDAITTIVDRSGVIIEDIRGPHILLCHGFGIIGYNGSLFNGPLWFSALSVVQPRIFL